MSRANPGQLAFSAGEVSPLLWARTDYQRAQTGLRQCRGFLPLRQGGITRAPGTLWRGATADNARARLLPFQFAADDALLLEFTPNLMRVWRYGALVMDGAVPYELATPYGAGAIARMRWVQSADVIYLVDGVHPPQRLARLALDHWTIGDAPFRRGPFEPENGDEDLTVTASADTGTVTLTGTGGLFRFGHVGGLFSLRSVDDDQIPTWTGNEHVVVGDRMRYDGRIYEVTAGDDTGVNPPTHTRGTVKAGYGDNVTWRYICDQVGIVRITAVAGGNSATGEVVKRLPPSIVSSGTYAWAEGAWSEKNGWPAAIALYDQRLALAATTTSPRTVWFSAIGDFTLFQPGIEADSAFAYSIAGVSSLNRILWLQSGTRGLHIGALGEEYSSRSTDAETAIGPTNATFRSDSTIGSIDGQPVAPDGRPVFIARDRRRLFELRYQFDQDANIAVELSLPAEHIGAQLRFEEVSWQSSPARLGWVRCASGEIALLIHDPAEDVLGWAVLPVAGGFVESIAVSAAADGSADVVMLAVRRRDAAGDLVRCIEEVAPVWDFLSGTAALASAVHFYAAVSKVDAAGFAIVSGLGHLNGHIVHAWTDQGGLGPFTVVGGVVDLGETVTQAVVGLLDETHVAETLDLQTPVREGSAVGRQRRVKALGLRLHRTAGGMVRQVERALGRRDVEGRWVSVTDPAVPNGETEGRSGLISLPAPAGWAQEVTQQFRPAGGAPMTILAVTQILESAEG